ncbi:hypothetical protein [Apibacter muscae]|uniref:hypothetical protein n=1 Tax=Apibacter muscae TaxID=2509004 RepID=UPI001C879F38|nr:hypothetical protein [Apibacter muscae]
MMKQEDIKEKVDLYLKNREHKKRYASFDYCFNYFKATDINKDFEKSCLVLATYLASWGMFRGSSFLLQEKSLAHFISTIEYIYKLKNDSPEIWNIDVHNYNEKNIDTILDIYKEIQERFTENHTHLTLVTKILLGVFGFIPAFDRNFRSTFSHFFIDDNNCGFTKVNKNSLNYIKIFYEENEEQIDDLSNKIYTIDFFDGKNTQIHYTKAKIIDMYGFQKGIEIELQKKNKYQP